MIQDNTDMEHFQYIECSLVEHCSVPHSGIPWSKVTSPLGSVIIDVFLGCDSPRPDPTANGHTPTHKGDQGGVLWMELELKNLRIHWHLEALKVQGLGVGRWRGLRGGPDQLSLCCCILMQNSKDSENSSLPTWLSRLLCEGILS